MSLANKKAETVTRAFRTLLKKLGDMKGGVLSTDACLEFANDGFQSLLKRNDLAWKMKGNGSPNDIAVLDRAI